MNDSSPSFCQAAVWVVDAGVFIACGRQQNTKYTALVRFAQQNEITFVIPQRVYEELGGAPERSTPGQTPSTVRLTTSGRRWLSPSNTPILRS